MRVKRVLETCLYVDDLSAAEEFYRRVLGLGLIARVDGRHVFFRCGRGVLLLFCPAATLESTGDVPTHGARGPGHVAFAMSTSEVDSWRRHLQENEVLIEKEITWPGGGYSIYFRDPASNCLELATPQTWRRSADDA
jgi:catechol 2,3-dioxygenase-like lactoylglutathione lyase family enzyme